MASLAPIAGAIVPGAGLVLDLVKDVKTLYERIKEINGSSEVCKALYKRLELIAKLLDSVKTKDNSAITTVIDKYRKKVEEFKKCLDGWITIAEEHTHTVSFRLRDVPEKIKEFNKEIDELRKDLYDANVIETKNWKDEDSDWKKKMDHGLDQFTKQIADESEKIMKLVEDLFDKLSKQGEDGHNKTQELVTDVLNSFRDYIQPKKKDIDQLVQSLTNASDDEEKDELLSELQTQCGLRVERKEKKNAIPGLLALVKYGSSDMRLPAAKKLSELAETHPKVVIAEGGVTPLMKLACEASPDQIEPIVAALGAIYYFSKDDDNQVSVEIVQPLLLVLRHEDATPGAKMMAAGVLNKLSRSKTGREKIAKHHGISALLDAFCDPSLNSVDQQRKTYAGKALKNLSKYKKFQLEVAEAISRLLRLLETSSETSSETQKDSALLILMNLSYSSEDFHAEIKANGEDLLWKLVHGGYDIKKNKTKAYAVSALELLSIFVEFSPKDFDPATGNFLAAYQMYRHREYDNLKSKDAADKAYEYLCFFIAGCE